MPAATKPRKKRVKKKAKAKKAKKAKGEKEHLTLAQRREKIRARYEKPVVIYDDDPEPPRVVTRFLRFNGLIGTGIKRGAILEIYGPEDSGKTSLSLSLAADAQRSAPKGKDHVVMVNFEIPQDYAWWRVLGLNTHKDQFTQLRPRSLEEGVADSVDLIKSGEVCAVIYDSVYAASAKDSLDVMETWQDPTKGGSSGAGGIAVEARQWGKAWTAIKGLFVEYDMIAIAVNQERVDIKASTGPRRKGKSFLPPKTTTPRGKALKFYAWLRLETSGSALLTEKKELRRDVDGRRVRVKVVKNKTSDDRRGYVFYDLIRGFGWDLTADLIDLSLDAGVISHSGGGHYTIGSRKIHGRQKLRDLIEAHELLRAKLSVRVEQWIAKLEVDEIGDLETEDDD